MNYTVHGNKIGMPAVMEEGGSNVGDSLHDLLIQPFPMFSTLICICLDATSISVKF